MATWPALERAVIGQCGGLAALGLVGYALSLAAGEGHLGRVAVACGAWGLSGALYGAASRRAWWPPRLGAYLGEAAMSVYVLHVPVISVLAHWVVRRAWPLPLQALALLLGTVVVTLGGYELGVRRSRYGRALMGMPSRPDR